VRSKGKGSTSPQKKREGENPRMSGTAEDDGCLPQYTTTDNGRPMTGSLRHAMSQSGTQNGASEVVGDGEQCGKWRKS
jgi:hypothetical protein